MIIINARQVVASQGRNQKKSQCHIVCGSRKPSQCSAKHEVAMKALADGWKQWQKSFPCFAQFLSCCAASVWRHALRPSGWDQTPLCIRLYGPVPHSPIHKKVLAHGRKAMY